MRYWIRPLFPPLVVLCCFALPLTAEVISGTLSGDSTLTPTGSPGVYTQNLSGTGVDALLGNFDFTSMSTVDFSGPPSIAISNGTFTETFGDGTLFGTSSGDGLGSGKGTATTEIDLVFTGGTGKFAGLTGEATFTGTITQNSATTESISGNYVGTLPEPSGVPMLASVSLVILGYSVVAPRLQRRREKT
jgi:hypothetical protein